MHRIRHIILCLVLISCSGIAGSVRAAEPSEAPPSDEQIQALFRTTYGQEEGQRRYEEWRATKDLPVDAYVAETAPAEEPTAPVVTTPAAPPPAPSDTHLASAPPAARPQPRPLKPYLLTEGDVLKISVWQWPDLQDQVIVRPDGKISFPLIGEIDALGLTIADVDRVLTDELKRYIKEPQVSIGISGFGGRKVIVLGNVKNPGVHAPTRNATLLEAIALAGGFGAGAYRKRIIILRGGIEHPQIIRANLKSVLAGKDPTLASNISVESEDIIYVAPTRLAQLLEDTDPLLKVINTAFQTYVGTTTLQQNKQ